MSKSRIKYYFVAMLVMLMAVVAQTAGPLTATASAAGEVVPVGETFGNSVRRMECPVVAMVVIDSCRD